MIACALLPRFALATAVGDRSELLQTPSALAPEPGGAQKVGEVSPAAEAFGVHPGLRLGEALARCPDLTLVPPDPAGVADRWERLLVRLESTGAAVEPERPGLACFDARGLLRLHGGIEGVLAAARRALRVPARFGVAPSRFAAVAAATRARSRRPEIVGGVGSAGRLGAVRLSASRYGAQPRDREVARAYLASLPVSLLRARPALAEIPEALERLGVGTLGELAAMPAAALADRFGSLGLLAHELASGGDSALSPRPPGEFLREALDLPEAGSGVQLERGLGLLIDRLLARRERRGRTLRAVVMSAVLVEQGGTWREQVVFREALSDPVRMRLALTPRLALLPAPAETLRLAVERFGPLASDQRGLLEAPAEARAGRLREAIRQARVAAGAEAALRVLTVDPDSRFPERRAVLTPFEG
ncbi:MAG: protein ImuB [Solirubrobacteraceae bacterium]|jgi:protein ImuB|nr:protein ImuB [Solirubrobacteraceae bacterium]